MANERMEIDVVANDLASANLKKTRDSIDQVGQQAKQTATDARKLNNAMGGVGRGAGQAGIQVQQFVGQIQGGVNPMIALSQQSADLGFALGVPLAGAIAGIAFSLGGILVPALFETKKAFADLRKEAEEVGLGLTQLPLELSEKNLLQLGEEAGKAATKTFDLQRKLSKLKSDLIIAQAVGDTADEFGDLGVNVEQTEAEIAKIEEQLTKANLSLTIANKRVQEFSDALYGQYIRANQAKGAITDYYAAIVPAQKQKADPLENLRKQADALKMQLNPMMALQKERQKLQSMEANGLITTDEYNRALDEATEKYQNMIPSIRAAKEAQDQFRQTTADTITDGLMGIVSGAKSAKDAFKDMARSIILDMVRMSIQKQVVGMVANIAMPSFAGGGYTGGGARSGGVDGRGGFPAILHPNETVVDHTKGQSMGGGVTVNLNISTGVSQTVRSEIANLLPQITQATKAAVADARMRGGSFSKSMVGA